MKGLPQMEETTAKKPGGKREGQKYKSLLVWDILQKRTDKNHAIQLKEIVKHLKIYGQTAVSKASGSPSERGHACGV